MARADFACAPRLRVRWAEVDMQKIVFNGHYLTYFDVAVTEYWRAVGLPYPETSAGTGSELYTVKSVVEYHAPAQYDDWLDIHIRCARIGRSSMQFLLEIWRYALVALGIGLVIFVHELGHFLAARRRVVRQPPGAARRHADRRLEHLEHHRGHRLAHRRHHPDRRRFQSHRRPVEVVRRRDSYPSSGH